MFVLVITNAEGKKAAGVKHENSYTFSMQNQGKYVNYATFSDGFKVMGGLDFPLNKSARDDRSVLKDIKNFKEGLSSIKFKFPKPIDAKTTYATAKACEKCHEKEYSSWKVTGHAQAFNLLKRKNAEYNPECIKCHVVGLERDNGFWDIESTPEMANVQCESCHGPGVKHVEEMEKNSTQYTSNFGFSSEISNIKKKDTYIKLPRSYICTQCHTKEQSPHFEFNTEKEKIKH